MYGKETDFNGYINKFAINKFNFSLKEGLKKWIVDNVKFSKEYPTISETLCEMIYSKYCTQPIAANLRKISEVIRTKPLFRENDIQLKDAPPLPCDTPFCRLLVWLMKFGLSYEDFKKEWKRHKYPNNELYIFIGYNWLLAPVVNNDPNIKIDCHFSELLDQTKIRVSYRDNGISFYITQISDAESYHQMQIFIQLDSLIAEFLYKEILINSH